MKMIFSKPKWSVQCEQVIIQMLKQRTRAAHSRGINLFLVSRSASMYTQLMHVRVEMPIFFGL